MRDDVSVRRWPEPVSGLCRLKGFRWSDDLIVDFPAMGALVDRMQASFLAGEFDSPSISAEVALTARQAFVGDRVRMDLPLRRACPACDGRGEASDQPCAQCGGTGHRVAVEAVRLFVPAGVGDGARLRFRVEVPPAEPTAVDLFVRIR